MFVWSASQQAGAQDKTSVPVCELGRKESEAGFCGFGLLHNTNSHNIKNTGLTFDLFSQRYVEHVVY